MIRLENRRTYHGDGTYIGRPSLLGNPYSVTVYGSQEAIRLYRRWLWARIKEQGEVYAELKRLAELAWQGDLTLICWCAPEPCHGAIVRISIEWLNSGEGQAFIDAHANEAGFSDGPADTELEQDYLGIRGLVYLPQFLPTEEQVRVLAEIDRAPWLSDLRRRVQHYGYKYDYRARSINHSMRVGPLPPFAVEVVQRLMSCGLITEFPDQAIVNEYQPGQGIGAHVDCETCFQSTIVTVSLGSSCEMDFVSLESREIRSTLLEPGSALVLRDAGRYRWMHRIMARTSDHGVPRGRRVSLTYRNVILTS
jgi:alkylated DNA repair dioxygenase AlkB